MKRILSYAPKAGAVVVIAALAAAFSHLHLDQRDRLLRLEGDVKLVADWVAAQQMRIPGRAKAK